MMNCVFRMPMPERYSAAIPTIRLLSSRAGVLCRKGEDDVADRASKDADSVPPAFGSCGRWNPVFHPDAQSGEQFGVFSFVKDVIDGSAERTAFRYFGNHGYSLI